MGEEQQADRISLEVAVTSSVLTLELGPPFPTSPFCLEIFLRSK